MRICPYFFSLFWLLFSAINLSAQDNFVTIPASSYTIVDGEVGVEVAVSVSEFLIAKTELTQREFAEIMGYNPSFHRGDEYPVESVSWWEAIRYCNLRSIKEGLEPCYNLSTGECNLGRKGYRLPTEAEWDYADSIVVKFTLRQFNNAYITKGHEETIRSYGNLGTSNEGIIPQLKKELQEKATKKVGSYPPNLFEVYDMIGNVWEWCTDYNDSRRDIFVPLHNPSGPSWGVERVLKGGSFLSLGRRVTRGLRSSLKPEYKSRFTGFRLARSSGSRKAVSPIYDEKWFGPYDMPPEGFRNNTGELSSLVTDSKGGRIRTDTRWQVKRKMLKEKWTDILGEMPLEPPEPSVKLVRTFKEENYTGKLMYLQVEPDYWEKIFLMIPDRPLTEPTPVVIAPYYDVDLPAGKNMGGRRRGRMGKYSFAYQMVRQGYIACCIRCYGQSYGEHGAETVANLKLKYPDLMGLGKWVWDVNRLIDYLYTLPEIDRNNIGIIGHSLGGKMAFYAAALDERITAAVSSEPGIGLSFSNYEDYWYLGEFIKSFDKSTDQHELLGLLAPRPFLLIGGDRADNDKSWYYINAAREVYSIFNKPLNIGYVNHRNGHAPTPEAVRLSVEWLKRFLRNPSE
jgi:formylglycine-generating enzyme required for sulfatase activity